MLPTSRSRRRRYGVELAVDTALGKAVHAGAATVPESHLLAAPDLLVAGVEPLVAEPYANYQPEHAGVVRPEQPVGHAEMLVLRLDCRVRHGWHGLYFSSCDHLGPSSHIGPIRAWTYCARNHKQLVRGKGPSFMGLSARRPRKDDQPVRTGLSCGSCAARASRKRAKKPTSTG